MFLSKTSHVFIIIIINYNIISYYIIGILSIPYKYIILNYNGINRCPYGTKLLKFLSKQFWIFHYILIKEIIIYVIAKSFKSVWPKQSIHFDLFNMINVYPSNPCFSAI